MTEFKNDSGEFLQYDGPDITLTKQAQSIFDFTIKGEFSQNFRIDNNSYNRDVLGYQSAMQVSNPAFTKNTFTLIRNGNNVSRGSIIVNSIDANTIECFFISGNASWFQLLQVNLKDLEYDDLTTLWSSIANNSSEGLIAPLVDWGYNAFRRGDEESYYIIGEAANLTGQKPDFYVSDTYPCIYLHTIIERLSNNTGVKIGYPLDTVVGDLLIDPIFKGIIITPNGPDLKWPSSQTEPYRVWAEKVANQSANNNDTINFPSIQYQGDFADYTTSGVYTAYKTATYRIEIDILLSTTDSFEIYLQRNGATDTNIFPSTLGSFTRYYGVFYYNLTKGDYFTVKIRNIAAPPVTVGLSSIKIEINESITPRKGPSSAGQTFTGVENYVHASAIVPDMKGVELIKFLVNYFNCICTYDVEAKQITLTKLYQITSQSDWSEYYRSHQEVYNRGLASNNYIKFKETPEPDIVRYNDINDVSFGGGNITTDYNSVDEKTLYQIPFGPAIDLTNRTYISGTRPYIQFFKLKDSDITIQYTSVTNNAGSARFNHTGSSEATFRRIYRIVSVAEFYSGYGVNNVSATGSPAYSEFYGVDYSFDDTGSLIAQDIEKVSSSHRLLYMVDGTSTALFDRPANDDATDSRISLAIDNIAGRENNITIGETYHTRLNNAFNSPLIRAKMLLPESIYESYQFDSLIYINSKDLTGLFFVNKISGYVGANQECLVELIFI